MPVPEALPERVLDMALTIQQIPAPTFEEGPRAAFVRQRFEQDGLADVRMDALGNVFGRLPGSASGRPLVVSAHIDTVFAREVDLTHHREPDRLFGPGIGDNSLGVAGLFGLLWALRRKAPGAVQSDLPGDVWLVANVGEEGLGNLRGMRAVVEQFRSDPRAYIVLEGMALGQVFHRGLGVRRYMIKVRTAGGHSWVDYGRPSAIHEMAALVTRLAGLSLPHRPRTSLNVGVIRGGSTVNTIAAEAYIELDMRSETGNALDDLARRVDNLVRDANRPDVQVRAELIGERPTGALKSDHPLVQLARHTLEEMGFQPHMGIGSTDANIPLSLGLPAICLGLTTGGGAHTLREYIHTRPLAQGLDQLLKVVVGAFRTLSPGQ